VYFFVTLVCLAAAVASVRRQQPVSHGTRWCVTASFFLILAVMRISGFEDHLREALRGWLQSSGMYAGRNAMQQPLTVLTLVVAPLAAVWMLFSGPALRRQPLILALRWAGMGVLVMICLIVLRLISLHQVDALLYGALKLNWGADLGACLMVVAAAGFYLRLVSRNP
jgi:hypothetical protein